jgi:excisionase family DNA binding protein
MKEGLGNYIEVPKFYKVTDIQEILGVSRSTAYNLVSDNNFPKISIGKLIKIPKQEFNLWLENSLEKGCI